MIDTNDSFAEKCQAGACRSCGHQGLLGVLNLGMMPLSDGFLTAQQLAQTERLYPLEVAFCPECSLVQILETVPPETLFGEDYPYYSSFSDDLLTHSRKNALDLIDRRRLNGDSFVVELASNDGYLLRNFVEKGVPVLGIDPARGPAQAAQKIGVPTLCTFFGQELATRLRAEGKAADVIIANNVLAHVADTNGFVQGIRTLLKDTGVAVIEVPYVRDLIDHCEFDTIYHEHLCYFSVTAVDRLFRRHGLFLNEVTHLSIHGGSLRLYIEPVENVGESVREMQRHEHLAAVDRHEYYQQFAQRVKDIRVNLCELLRTLRSQGKRLAAYGAAAKGTIMLNYLGADASTIGYVVDRNVHKQGKYVPGMRILIDDPARLLQEMPDYVLLLPWNFKDEILSQQQPYRARGGRFIIPIPQPAIV